MVFMKEHAYSFCIAVAMLVTSVSIYAQSVDDLIGDMDLEKQTRVQEDSIDKKDLKNLSATVFCEAEGFEGVSPVANDVYDSWACFWGQENFSRRAYVGYWGAVAGKKVSRKIKIPVDGKYKVWARFQMKVGGNGRFKIEIVQDGKTVFSKKYYDFILDKGDYAVALEKEKGWSFDDNDKEKMVSGYEIIWESNEGELKKGDAVMYLISDETRKPVVSRVIDCICITKSMTYKPKVRDVTSMFVRFKFTELYPEDAESRLMLHFLRRDGHRTDLGYWFWKDLDTDVYKPDGEEFGKGEYTAWVDLNKYLTRGVGPCTVRTEFKSDKPITKSRCEIQIAWGPREEQLIRAFTEKGNGSAFGFDVPCENIPEDRYFQMIRSVSEQVEEHYNFAKDLNLNDDDVPKKLLISTSGFLGWNEYFCDPELMMKELAVIKTLGVNEIIAGYTFDQKLMREMGFRDTTFGGSASMPLVNPYVDEIHSCPNRPGEDSRFVDQYIYGQIDYKHYVKNNLIGKISRYKMGDEIGVIVSAKHVENCTYCVPAFRGYLKDVCGLKPADFGRKSYDEIKFIAEKDDADGKYSKKLYYYSRRFLSYNTVDMYRKLNKVIEKYFGRVPTYANYSPAILHSNEVGELDWLEMGRLGGTTLPWSEDWWCKPVSFLVDYLRSQGKYHGETVGMYCVGHSQDHQRKFLSEVAHGAKMFWLYDYVPYFSSNGDAFSEETTSVKGFSEVTRIVGKADDLFYYGKLRKPQVALLYSRSGEIWSKDKSAMVELKRVYLALLYNQITVDILNEDDLLNDELKNYKVIFVFYRNIKADGIRKIAEWVKSGGIIIGSVDCGMRDEADQKDNTLDDVFGVKRLSVNRIYTEISPIAKVDLADTVPKGILNVTDDKLLSPMEMNWTEYKVLAKIHSAKTLAVFDDKYPAVSYNEYGKGRALYFSTYPGAILFADVNPFWVPVLSEQQSRQFALIDRIIKYFGIEKEVEVSEFGVEATVIESDIGIAVPLINYNKNELSRVTVKIRYPKEFKSIESSLNGTLDFKRTGDMIEVNLPLKLVDVIIIRN